MPRCAVLGDPIEHSLSPVLHAAAYEALGLTDWSYDAHRVGEQDLPGFLAGLHAQGAEGWRGLSLTMPLKRTVLPLLDEVAPTASLAGGANTVLLDEGPDGPRLRGDNTDVPGAASAIRERHDGPVGRAVVVGGGATAASALLALADLGCREATLLVRDASRASATLDAVARHDASPAVTVVSIDDGGPVAADIVVSTVPAAAQTSGLLSRLDGVPVVFEVLYDPWPTPLVRQALDRGHTLVGGLDLLVHQAARQVELMTGAAVAPVAAMRRAGEDALAARAGH